MMLSGARIAISASDAVQADISISGRYIRFGGTGLARAVDMHGFLILPGLINAHDHLEFNLFPRLGGRRYRNATEWAADIYHPEQAPLKQHLQIPKPVRLLWGGLKNLLAGVTSVSHHNPYNAAVFEHRYPVRVIRRFGWAHSLKFCSNVGERFRETPRDAPFLIHAGEGSDDEARRELHRLDEKGALGPSTVIIHGVALQKEEICLLKARGSSVVWCPSSNHFILGKTLSTEVLQSGIPVALGNDSALTAEGDFLDELAAARRHTDVCRLYEMVTEKAARIFQLNSGEGSIREGGVADLVIVRDEGQSPAEALLFLRPELVMVNGEIKLLSFRMAARFKLRNMTRFEAISVEGRGRSFVDFPVASAKGQAIKHLGDDLRLAGKQIAV
jgi:cytosine/adenosine deaminase-related metal-dependent hydrolase